MYPQSNRRGPTALALALLLSACGEMDRTVAPQVAPRFSESVDLQSEEAARLARYSANAPALQAGFAMTMIGPRGGSLRLAGFEIVVPAGAVDRLTAFTIYLPLRGSDAAGLVMAEFGPHGRTFSVPVTIRAPHRGTTAESDDGTRILWWTGETWSAYPTRLLADDRLETTTTHFSEWGVEASRGITTAGGRPHR